MSRRLNPHTWLPAAAFALTACSSTNEPPAIQSRVALQAFGDCDELETYIEDTAVQSFRNQMRGGGIFLAPQAGERTADAAATPNQSGPKAYTTTNVQVKGVDEGDFIKNNGTHIFVLAGNRLNILQSWPATDLRVIAKLDVEGYPQELYLDDVRHRLVVLGSVFAPYATTPEGASIDCLYYGGCGEWAVATKVTVIDVSNPATPRITDEQYLPGWLQSSRRIDGSLRLVLIDNFRWPNNLKWSPDYDEGLYQDEERLKAAYEDLADENEPLIRARNLSDWLPNGRRRLDDGSLIEVGYDCRDFHKVTAPVTLGFTTVATIDLDRREQVPTRTSIIADTSEVYSSTDNLYLATRHWWWWFAADQEDFTYLFKLDVTHPDKAVFVAAGGVEGYALNQFSLDEDNGYLRIATTTSKRVEDEENPWRVELANRVSVLAENDGRLDVIGATPDLAPGERVQSARFLGDKGYVVTFRNVDPLFTLDLSEPSAPRVAGVLKVPGFSSYIHPLDAGHILTIGIDVPDPGQGGQVAWQERRMKLSIFDVSDLSDPKEAFVTTVGTAYGWSEAAWEHKAFNYFPERGLLAIPFSDYRPSSDPNVYWGEFVSDLRVFSVSAERGITPVGSVSMKDIYQTYSYQDWSWSWSPWIRRSVMADDFVYAISDAGVRVANTAALDRPIATATFDRVLYR